MHNAVANVWVRHSSRWPERRPAVARADTIDGGRSQRQGQTGAGKQVVIGRRK